MKCEQHQCIYHIGPGKNSCDPSFVSPHVLFGSTISSCSQLIIELQSSMSISSFAHEFVLGLLESLAIRIFNCINLCLAPYFGTKLVGVATCVWLTCSCASLLAGWISSVASGEWPTCCCICRVSGRGVDIFV